jgi:hypothetical protein
MMNFQTVKYRRSGSIVCWWLACFAICCPLKAQWLHVPVKGIPRTADGTPNLTAAAPRTADGKPELSGVWLGDQGLKYIQNLAADLKPGELPIQPWAAALAKERAESFEGGTGVHSSELPPTHCLPTAISMLDGTGGLYPLKIVQQAELVVILYELGQFRQIFLDGRALPKDPNPTWMGYSIGRWEEGALVVDSAGFNGKMWLDMMGRPATEALHLTERFRRPDFGHLEVTLTIDDPTAYTKPWSATQTLRLFPDTDLLEYVCNENEKDLQHIK